jgi:CheY-like chemotaxis protein
MSKVNCILLVEDDEMSRHIIEQVVMRVDAANHFIVTKNGQEALDYIDNALRAEADSVPLPDIILLDLHMPVMDGRRFLEEMNLRFGPELQGCVYPFINEEPTEADFIDWRHMICGYIEKPVTIQRLKEVLEEVSGRNNNR